VSSTLFNTALLSGMDIVEREPVEGERDFSIKY